MRIFIILLTSLALSTAAFAQQREYIIVSGGISLMKWEKYKAQPHDKWWLNFIRAARIRIEELRAEQGPDAFITWHVYAPAYTRRIREQPEDMFGIIRSVQEKYHVKLIFFDKGDHIIDYLNNGQDRSKIKVALFEYFGHSNRACFMFDYSNAIDSASKAWLHEDDLVKIRRDIWAPDAFTRSWGCHTGESMSQKWRAATGIAMMGAVGKTDYQTHTLPLLSAINGRWAQ